MKNNRYFHITALTVVLGLALAACRLVRTFIPMAVLPELDIPNMVLLSLAALLLDHYLVSGSGHSDIVTLLLAALTFGLLPFTSGMAAVDEALKLAVVGGIVFTLTAWLFSQMQDRLSSGPAAKAAPLFSALGLFLAAQCCMGFEI